MTADSEGLAPADDLADDAEPAEVEAGSEAEEPGDGASDDALEEAASVVEDDLAAIVAERDDYLAALRRVQADFENFRKQTLKRNTELIERAAVGIVEKLLPVLDACEGALTHGHDDVKPIYDALMNVLEKEGLAIVYPADEPFDPTQHDAVMHEEGDGDDAVVTDVLRTGYQWKGRVLRPAMVKVKG